MRKIVPVDLGGSPSLCAVAPPCRPCWSPESAAALIEATQRRFPSRSIEVGFFHGAFPSKEMLEAASGYPLRLSCHPNDLNPDRAERFRVAGGDTIEIEVMSLDPHVLRTCARDYKISRVRRMASRLRDLGFKVGIHLVPGLPGQDIDSALKDAEALVEDDGPWVDFVRIWPALGFAGATLSDWAKTGKWVPLDVGQAVDVVGRIVGICERSGIEVARVGIQPGQDIPVQATAGPVHPNLRGEIASQRFARLMRNVLSERHEGAIVTIAVNPKDLHLAKGTSNINSREMRSRYDLADIQIETDNDVARGSVRIARVE